MVLYEFGISVHYLLAEVEKLRTRRLIRRVQQARTDLVVASFTSSCVADLIPHCQSAKRAWHQALRRLHRHSVYATSLDEYQIQEQERRLDELDNELRLLVEAYHFCV